MRLIVLKRNPPSMSSPWMLSIAEAQGETEGVNKSL